MEDNNEIIETTTEEREIVIVKVPLDKESLSTIKIYADMLKVDQGSLLNNIVRNGLKSIRGKLNELPYTDYQKIIKSHTAKQIS